MPPDTAEVRLLAGRFAKHLKARRVAVGLTQEALADRVGITRQAVSQIEGGGGVSLPVAMALAEALNTRIGNLLKP